MRATFTSSVQWHSAAGIARLLALCIALVPTASRAQSYPVKPIRMIAPEAGGGNDLVARVVAQGMATAIGQPVIVDNRSALRAMEMAAKSTPDGYTLLVTGSTLWLAPLLQPVSFNPTADFTPIMLAANSPSLLVVHPSVAARSVRELVTLAKAKPGQLNYGSAASASSSHLAAELFKAMAGVDIVRIAYKGTAQALTDLISAQTQLMFPTVGATMPHVKAGRLRALAVASQQPSALTPGVPTVAASGLPGYEAGTATAMFAPARTPTALVSKLHIAAVNALSAADTREKLLIGGVEPIANTPAQLAAAVKADMLRWGKLIKDTGIRVD